MPYGAKLRFARNAERRSLRGGTVSSRPTVTTRLLSVIALSENGEGGTEKRSDDVTGVANGTEGSVPYGAKLRFTRNAERRSLRGGMGPSRPAIYISFVKNAEKIYPGF